MMVRLFAHEQKRACAPTPSAILSTLSRFMANCNPWKRLRHCLKREAARAGGKEVSPYNEAAAVQCRTSFRLRRQRQGISPGRQLLNMSASSRAEPQATATVALIGLSLSCTDALRAAFRQFSIDVLELSGDAKSELENRKFQGCVVRLEEGSAPLVDAVRKSSCNRTIPLIGVCPPETDMRLFGRFGLNAILKEPVDRQEALKMVRGTHLLILNELRRYVRIPMVLEVHMQLNGTGFGGLTRDISYGGISISTQQDVSPDNDVELALTLPNGIPAKVNGSIIWRHHPDLIGIRFAAADERRAVIRKWIDDYFQML